MSSLKASAAGLAQIKQARKVKGWSIEDPRWLKAASAELDSNWKPSDYYEASLSTWKRFLRGESIRPEAFMAFCRVLGLDWQLLIEAVSELSKLSVAHQDLSEAPDVSAFVGRSQELEILNQWITQDQCHLVAVLGLGGIGKTALTVKLVEQVQPQFEYVIWRSLRNTPPIHNLLTELILFLSNQQAVNQPDRLEDQIACLMQYLRQQRCLLVLDNLESILQGGDRSGRYLEGYDGYGQLLRRVGDERHQSCVVITSREKPIGINWIENEQGVVRSQYLKGLPDVDGQAILTTKGLNLGESQCKLVTYYKGNPLALKIVAATIQSMFGGDTTEFLQQGTTVFGDIWNLLDQQFDRLSKLEQQVMYWLAVSGDWVTLTELREDMVAAVSPHELFDAVRSLQERSLVETSAEGFTQQPVVMEYVTGKFIHHVYEEVTTQAFNLFQSHALIKAQAKDYIRDAQSRSILEPLANKLLYYLGSRQTLKHYLMQIVKGQQQASPQQPGYLAGNILNLLCHLKIDLTGCDFSHLHIRQAYLVGVSLHDVNFTSCNLSTSVFTETLTATLSVVFSPNGKLFASGNADGIVRVWQTADKSKLVSCKGHTSWVWRVAFSPDSQLLATGSFDQTVKLWDAQTGLHLNTLTGHSDWVWAVAFSPDGQLLASASNDRTVRLWDTTTGQCIQTLSQHTSGVHSVVFSPNGQLVASSGIDCTIKLWDTKTGKLVDSLNAHEHWVSSIAFSRDGKYLISGSHDQTIKVWDLATRQCLKILRGHSSYVLSIALSSDGRTLASGSADCTVRVWDIVAGECLKVLQGHPNGVWSVAFHPDGQTLISGSNDSMVKVWNVKNGQSLKTIQGYCAGIRSIAFSVDGQWLASGSDDKTIRLWEAHSGNCFKTFKGHTSWIWSVGFSPDQQLIASSSSDCTIRLWNPNTGKEVRVLQGHTNLVMSITFSPKDNLLVSGSLDQTVRLWNVQTGQCNHTLTCSGRIWAVAFSPDGQTFASCNDDRSIQLWDVKTGECIRVLEGHTALVFSIAFSPDGKAIASGGSDQSVKLWDAELGKCIHTLSHSGGVWEVAFSPNSQLLASASEDQTISLWDVQTGERMKMLPSQTGEAWTVAFSPDGSTLAGAGQNGMIHLWNVETGERVKTISNKRPYEQMNITKVTGLTAAQQDSLKTLGAFLG